MAVIYITLEQQYWETNIPCRKPFWSDYTLRLKILLQYISAAPLFLWCYTRCYSSVELTENEIQNQYILCHSRREDEKFHWPAICASPWQEQTVTAELWSFFCNCNDSKKDNFLPHSPIYTMKYVNKIITELLWQQKLWMSNFTIFYFILTSCPLYWQSNPNWGRRVSQCFHKSCIYRFDLVITLSWSV